MARTLELIFPTGFSIAAEVIARGADAITETINLTERTTAKQHYRGTIGVGTAAGDYDLNIKLQSGGTYVGYDWVRIEATDNTTYYARSPSRVEEIASAAAQDIADLINVNAGSGARTVVITITDGTNPLENVSVRVSQGAESYVQLTNASGQATFYLDDATWTVTATKPLYTLAAQSLIVNGNEAVTYAMTSLGNSAPSAPNLSVGTLLCLGTDGTAEQGVVVYFRLVDGPGTAGYAYDEAEWSETSNASGIVQSEFVIGARYRMRRGTHGSDEEFTVANAASFNIAEVVGAP